MKRIIFWWNAGVGSMDAATGLLLMWAPAWTLRLMGLQPVGAEARVFLSWMGAFVFSVGASYFLVLRGDEPRRGEMVWQMTALVRAVVAVFVVTKVAQGTLEPLWLTVAVTDAAVAVVQWRGIQKQWWHK
jgi:hypothetical protein